ncbi:MAG: PilZ domain-containing protein [Acidobacteria bacterium]|nr:PilZ domain-containing protein [Acidobacteriota bacterium]
MSINQRRHLRFSLDIPATLVSKYGESHQTLLQQISIGGCFTDWEENLYPGDEFRLEIELPNKNKLPLRSKAIYRFEDTGIGVRFIDITEFEQELISTIINAHMIREGLPEYPDPFQVPAKFIEDDQSPKIKDRRREREEMLEQAMAGEDAS